MIRPFDIVRPKSEFVSNFLTRKAMSSIRVDQGDNVIEVSAEFMDDNQIKQWLGAVGMVTDTNGHKCCVKWFDKGTGLHTAWWEEGDLDIVNNLADIFADVMAHNYGSNIKQG